MDLANKVAVITGGANGIGEATALAFAREGAHVVVADIEGKRARAVADEVRATGVRAIGVQVDVSDMQSVQNLADVSWREFGEVNILFNNAGVGVMKPLHELSEANWNWVLGVNLGGIYHGVRAFVPRMLAQRAPAHIINTSSEHGIALPSGGLAAYTASKHAVFGLSDVMRRDYEPLGISVSVLCPGWVNTTIWNAMRNRPERFGGARTLPEEVGQTWKDRGADPADVARAVVRGVKNEDFYILSHPEVRSLVEDRYKELIEAFENAGLE
jgi:NAD(P)-dependent dehydrogenase (short-subunit alcohol dehydrogenase family)